MTREELVEFLKNSLSVQIDSGGNYSYGNSYLNVTVRLLLAGDDGTVTEISSSSIQIDDR